ncbi:MAG: hypothetical protein ACE5GO_06355 [Anaerolineales bacterium]
MYPSPVSPTSQQVIARIDVIIRELEVLRQQVATVISVPLRVSEKTNPASELFGLLGRGDWHEYDMFLDFTRFSDEK